MRNKSFLNFSDFSRNDIMTILSLNSSSDAIKNKTLGMIFEKQSTRKGGLRNEITAKFCAWAR